MIVATRPEPTVRPPSRSDFAYLETYLLRFCRFVTHFMDILPIIFTFSEGNVAPEYHENSLLSST